MVLSSFFSAVDGNRFGRPTHDSSHLVSSHGHLNIQHHRIKSFLEVGDFLANSLLQIVDAASPCLSGSDHTNDVVRTRMYAAVYISKMCSPFLCRQSVHICSRVAC